METNNYNSDILFDDAQLLGEKLKMDFSKSSDTDCTSYTAVDDDLSISE